MATTMYSGDAGAAQALDYTRIIALSGGSPISGSRIDSVVAAALMSTNAYSNTYQVRARLLNSVGATLAEVTRTDIKFTSSNYGGAIWQFDFGTSVDVNSIASISFFGLNEASKIFVKNTPQTVTIGYTAYTNCSAPSSASVSPTLAETAPTLTWSGAGAGAANSITGYEIQYAESADNSIWGDWTALKTVTTADTSGSTTVDLPATRGYYRKYRIRTQGGAGSSYYSAWKETNGIRYNRLPSAPTSFVASPDVYVSGYISLVYSGASDPDGNPLSHNVQYAMSADGVAWGAWASLANNSTTHTPTLGDNAYIKYQARAVDSAGGVSDYLESNVCGKNTAPGDLTINYPQASKTIHNSRPRFLVTLGSDPEAHMQVITADGYTASRASNLAAGAKVILRRTNDATAGTVSVSAKAADVHGLESSAVTRDTTYSAPVYTDTIEKGTAKIKAAHINELRGMVEDARAYYGFGVNVIDTDTSAETLVATTSPSEVTSVVDDVFLLPNTTYTISGFWRSQSNCMGMELLVYYTASPMTDYHYWNRPYSVPGVLFSYTFTTSTGGNYRVRIDNNGSTGGSCGLWYKEIKLESGTFSSDYNSASMKWAETITAGVTKTRNWKAHITELRNAINDVVAIINAWDELSSTNRVPAFAWTTITEKPDAAAMNQLREVITWL